MKMTADTTTPPSLGELYNPPHALGWTPTSLYTIADWINGLAFKDVHFSKTGKPVIKIAEIKNGITGQTQFTDGEYKNDVHIKAGDTLFAWSGQPETSIGVSIWQGQDGWLNQHIFKVLPHEGIDRDFLYFFLMSLNPYFVRIAKNKQTTGLGHITKEDLRAMQVGIPSIGVQRAIAMTVLPLQQKMELLWRQNETLEQIAQGIFNEWFAKSEKTNGVATLADFVQHIKEQVIPTNAPTQIFNHYSIPAFDANKTPVPEAGVGILSNKYRVLGNSILFSKLNPDTPRVWVVITPCDNAICSTEFLVLQPKNKSLLPFVYAILCYSEYARELANKVQGTSSSHQRLRPEDILSIEFPMPENGVLDSYCALANPLLKQVENNEAQIRTLAATRDLLLPRLMSGDVRVRTD